MQSWTQSCNSSLLRCSLRLEKKIPFFSSLIHALSDTAGMYVFCGSSMTEVLRLSQSKLCCRVMML
ncbi:hypothetical protein Hanom_Chr14g01329801 [Helianthus anomalus]